MPGPGLDHEQVDLGQVGAVDLEDVGAVGGEEPSGHGAGDDPGQVEHPDARQRAVVGRLGDLGLGRADPLDVQEREPGEGLTLGMGQPVGGRTLLRGTHPGGGQRVLQGLGLPGRHRGGDRVPVRLVEAEHGEAAGLVVREVGVDLDPAVVGRAVDPGDRPPG